MPPYTTGASKRGIDLYPAQEEAILEVFRFLRMLANKEYQEIDETFPLDQMFPEARWKYTELGNAMEDKRFRK